ncbi:MAG: hypothetical protein QXN66_05360 [Thermoplasmatales archaeon]
MTEDTETKKRLKQASIAVNSIYCISCSRLFTTGIRKIAGIVKVEEFPISNKFKLTYDSEHTNMEKLSQEIHLLAEKCGLKNQIIIRFL